MAEARQSMITLKSNFLANSDSMQKMAIHALVNPVIIFKKEAKESKMPQECTFGQNASKLVVFFSFLLFWNQSVERRTTKNTMFRKVCFRPCIVNDKLLVCNYTSFCGIQFLLNVNLTKITATLLTLETNSVILV